MHCAKIYTIFFVECIIWTFLSSVKFCLSNRLTAIVQVNAQRLLLFWIPKFQKGQKPQILQKWVLGAVRGHLRSLAMSPLLDHTWFLVVISSNDRAILYRYRDIARYYVKNRKKFPNPRINYRVDLRHYLTDPCQIWWTYRLIITDEHHFFDFLFSFHITSDGA